MNQFESSTVADIVSFNPNSAAIFKKYQIDFCCKGNIPLTDAAKKAGVDSTQLIREIESLTRKPGSHLRIHAWDIGMICDYIVNNHHSYVKNITPQIQAILEKVTRVHGDSHPELKDIYIKFNALASELLQHMKKEEDALFPAAKTSGKKTDPELIKAIEGEHDNAGNLAAEINRLTGRYTPPQDACNSYRVLYQLLEEFEDDLHQHVHLENNVLIPKLRQ